MTISTVCSTELQSCFRHYFRPNDKTMPMKISRVTVPRHSVPHWKVHSSITGTKRQMYHVGQKNCTKLSLITLSNLLFW